MQSQQGHGCTKRVEVPIVAENMNWLVRSLVGSTRKPMDTHSLKRVIRTNLHHVEDVREIGETKVLLTFDTVEHADEAYTFKMDTLLQVFHRIRRWEESERCVSHKVWLECYGMPLHVWSPETFTVVGGLWGEVLHCDIQAGAGASFRVGRFQVDTCEFDEIKEWVHIAIGSKEFTVYVKQMGLEAGGLEISVESKKDYEGSDVDSSREYSMTKTAVQWDPAADVITGNAQGADWGKDRIVIPEVLFNDVNVEFLNFKKYGDAVDLVSSTQNHGKAVTKGYGSEEVDSDRMVIQRICTRGERDIDFSIIPSGPLPMGHPLRYQTGCYMEGCETGLDHLNPTLNQKGFGSWGLEGVRLEWGKTDGSGLGWKGANRVTGALTCEQMERTEGRRVERLGKGEQMERASLAASGREVHNEAANLAGMCTGVGWGVDGGGGTVRGGGMRAVNEGRIQVMTGKEGDVDDGIAEGSAPPPHLNRLGEYVTSLWADRGEEEGIQGMANAEGTFVDGAKSETDRGRITKGDEDRISKEAQIKENEVTWALAMESGAVLYDEEVDIMSILQAQNEEIAEKRKLSKQKEKARRSRPKNKRMVSLLETKREVISKYDVARIWENSTVGWEFVESVGAAGRLLLMWDDMMFQKSNCYKGDRWLCIEGVLTKNNFQCAYCLVYGAHGREEKRVIWEELSYIAGLCQGPFCLLGDFNEILQVEDRKGLTSFPVSAEEFKSWVQDMQLVDLPLTDRKFTWFRGQSGSRVDRVLVNIEWVEEFPVIRLKGGPKDLSDHFPLIVEDTRVRGGPRPFRV
ncbi:hypothetical protein AHAS_Ahas20G0253400 [Arachis hypogaea]